MAPVLQLMEYASFASCPAVPSVRSSLVDKERMRSLGDCCSHCCEFLQCFNTVAWATWRHAASKWCASVIPVVFLETWRQYHVWSQMSSVYTVVLNVGADVHAADQDGNTALHIAAQYGHELLINTLLQHEANILKYLFFLSPSLESLTFCELVWLWLCCMTLLRVQDAFMWLRCYCVYSA